MKESITAADEIISSRQEAGWKYLGTFNHRKNDRPWLFHT